MTSLADETLMLYADGLLDHAESEHIAGIATQDSEVRARIEMFRATASGDLGSLFEDYLKTPAPTLGPHVPSTLETEPAAEPRRMAANRPRRLAVAEHYGQMLPLLAATLVLFCGFGIGWLLHARTGSQASALDDVVEYRAGKLIARGTLRHALETVPSGQQAVGAGADGPTIAVRMTFQDESSRYCREYELGTATQRQGGVACRTGADWTINFHALLQPASREVGRIVPAGGSRATMDAVVGSMIVGNPLAPESEAKLLRGRWEP
jgi:hypothetical protein